MEASPAKLHSTAGVVAALLQEARCLGRIPARRGAITVFGPLRVCLSGVGSARATEAARALLEDGATALLSWGTCGALKPGLDAGTLLLPSRVMDESRVYEVDSGWRRRIEVAANALRISAEPLLSSTQALMTVDDKAAAQAATGAAGVDMESAAVAAVAEAAGVPFLVLRVVLDRADQSLPSAILAAVNEIGQPRLAPMLYGLARYPIAVQSMARNLRLARHSLRLLAGLLPDSLVCTDGNPA